MSQSVAKAAQPSVLSDEIRDGLLQDLLAVGLILRQLETTASEGAARRIASASQAIDADVRAVRGIIDRLKAA
jgi:signal transduction histidine kinase